MCTHTSKSVLMAMSINAVCRGACWHHGLCSVVHLCKATSHSVVIIIPVTTACTSCQFTTAACPENLKPQYGVSTDGISLSDLQVERCKAACCHKHAAATCQVCRCYGRSWQLTHLCDQEVHLSPPLFAGRQQVTFLINLRCFVLCCAMLCCAKPCCTLLCCAMLLCIEGWPTSLLHCMSCCAAIRCSALLQS